VFNSGIHHLAGQDYVLLQEGFEASGSNTTLIISTMNCQAGQDIIHNFISNPPSGSSPQTVSEMKKIKLTQ